MKPCVLVSACLLGEPCRYDGASKPCDNVLALGENFTLIPVCPEVLGGLSTPRIPCEIQNGRVIRQDGKDLTASYERGAQKALEIARENGVICAILKNKSPSCGKIRYDGTFTRALIPLPGITTALFTKHNISVFSEDEFSTSEELQKLIHKKR